MKRRALATLVLLSALSLPSATYAQYPDPAKRITFVVPFSSGGSNDILARAIGQKLSEAWKLPVIIDNQVGASGSLGASRVAKSAPDGYTLMLGTNSPLSAVPYLMKRPPYDAIKDFTPITRVGSYTLMLVVHPGIPAKSMKELVEYAKANPGKLSYASANTSGIVAGATLGHWAEIDILHVPYKSPAPALQDLVAGRVSMMFTDLTTGRPLVESGALRALATTRLHRSTLYPELPTMDEAGITGFDMDSWGGIVGPAHMPTEIVTRLNTELRKIIDDPEVKGSLGRVGFEAFSSTPKEFADTIKVQLGKWGKMVKDAGIQAE